jgi:hypothetical protein
LGNVGVGAVTTPGQLSGGVERDCAQLIFHWLWLAARRWSRRKPRAVGITVLLSLSRSPLIMQNRDRKVEPELQQKVRIAHSPLNLESSWFEAFFRIITSLNTCKLSWMINWVVLVLKRLQRLDQA